MEDGLQLSFDEPCWKSIDVGLKKDFCFSDFPKLVLGELPTISVFECRIASRVSNKRRLYLPQSVSTEGAIQSRWRGHETVPPESVQLLQF
jgi:hypothetical protein